MKAQYFMSGEIEIILSDGEFSDLYEGPIRGKISMLDKENQPYAERDLEMVACMNCDGLPAKLESFPNGVVLGEITSYRLVLEEDGYITLYETGKLSERLDGIGGRVDITLEEKI